MGALTVAQFYDLSCERLRRSVLDEFDKFHLYEGKIDAYLFSRLIELSEEE